MLLVRPRSGKAAEFYSLATFERSVARRVMSRLHFSLWSSTPAQVYLKEFWYPVALFRGVRRIRDFLAREWTPCSRQVWQARRALL